MICCPRCKVRCTKDELQEAYTEDRRRPAIIVDSADGPMFLGEQDAVVQGLTGRPAWVKTRKPDLERVCPACISDLR